MLEYIFAVLEWCKVVIFLRGKDKKVLFKEGEIWWCSIGMNVGVEVYGKGRKFERPVLILKKFNSSFFFGIPITSQVKKGIWYAPIYFGEAEAMAMLSHARPFDAIRLTKRMGTLTEENFREIQGAFLEFYGAPPKITPENNHPAERAGDHSSPAEEPENSG
jgi:mRNA interferase MazF